MGIKLMKNFDRPYTATTIKEFWARWHISLSTWFRDYLYFPLGGSRCSKPRHMFNLFMVFFVSGLWHGANWTFVIWGLLHAVYRIVGELTYKKREALWAKMHVDTKKTWFRALRRVITFVLVCFAWIFFRANSISDMGVIFSNLAVGWGNIPETLTSMGIGITSSIVAILSVIVMSQLDILTERNEADGAICTKSSTVWLVWAVALAWIMLLSVGGASSFIYFQF
jgi:D-alanyl-lipoteichoic acid acyltransferase DltB (MBOAT superfamily)